MPRTYGIAPHTPPMTKEFEAGFARWEATLDGPMPLDRRHYLQHARPDETFAEWRERMTKEQHGQA